MMSGRVVADAIAPDRLTPTWGSGTVRRSHLGPRK